MVPSTKEFMTKLPDEYKAAIAAGITIKAVDRNPELCRFAYDCTNSQCHKHTSDEQRVLSALRRVNAGRSRSGKDGWRAQN
jgi:hypothetical protein